MKPKNKALAAALAVLTLSVTLSILLPKLLHMTGTKIWIVRGGLWLLGLVAAIIVYLLLREKKGANASPEQRSEIDVAVAAARTRLAAAKGKAGAQFGHLPILLVTGPVSAAKTTVVSRSGLQPDLLAGEVMRGDTVAPTQSLNIWFAHGTLLVEAAGRLTGDAAEWKKLVRYIQPKRLGAVMSRGKQAPRMAVVCLGCDELLKPGASEAVPALAQKLRARLAEASQQLGIRLPVYVIFTKADRLPYFEDFVRSFTHDEARDVLGATLPVPQVGNVGHYAERETRRLASAFQSVFHGLALRRIDVLPRETQEPVKAGAYEFPREFRKVTDLTSLFLLELCRPSQLGVSPFLRGFYFTGVRPVLVHDVAVSAPVQPRMQGSSSTPVDATSVFDPRMLMQQQAPQPVAQTGSRKVPEWVFLDRVFRDVIMRDTVAQGVTAGGTKVTLGRRIVLAAMIGALCFLSLGMTVSVISNSRLLRATRASVESARSLTAGGGLPDLDALQRLDQLRAQSERLNNYRRHGNPLRTAWMLYAGNGVQEDVRKLYFRRFDELLWETARTRLVTTLATLRSMPPASVNYDSTYDALKAYLVTTERPDSAKRAFLAPVLTRIWLSGGQIDDQRRNLIAQQFGFFADELPWGNPYQPQRDLALVESSRAFLRAFSGEDQLYSSVLNIARETAPPVQWQDQQSVQNTYAVASEFTSAGWSRAQRALGDLPRLLNRETWVLENVIPEGDRRRIEAALRERYARDYMAAWMQFLDAGRVPAFANLNDAASRLSVLSRSTSPLIGMIQLASNNTAVDTSQMTKSFAPAHDLAKPNSPDAADGAIKYIQKMKTLTDAVNQVASSAGATRASLTAQARMSASDVKAIVNELSGKYMSGQAQVVSASLSRLLTTPVTLAEKVLGGIGKDDANREGVSFCQQPTGPRRLQGRFPFSRSGATEANVAEVRELLAPNNGVVWMYYQDKLSSLFVKRGSGYAAQTGGEIEGNPAYADYLTRLARVSNGLFNEDGKLEIAFSLRMQTTAAIPQITVNFEGRQWTFTQTSAASQNFLWTGASLPTRISVVVGNRTEPILDLLPSPWWIFHALSEAQVEERGPDQYNVTWRRNAISVTGELTLVEPSAIFHSNTLSGVSNCNISVAR